MPLPRGYTLSCASALSTLRSYRALASLTSHRVTGALLDQYEALIAIETAKGTSRADAALQVLETGQRRALYDRM
jgi:hypothetical protein